MGGWQSLYCVHSSRDTFIVVYLKPRRIAATTVAKRVAEEKRSVLGETVGYSVHFDYNFNRNGKITQIKYMTDKELLREMTHNPMVRLLFVAYCVVE